MPTSRTRKKATQKKAAQNIQREQQARHQAFKRVVGAALNDVPNCTDCHGERVEVRPDQVPAETWEGMAPMRAALEAQGSSVRQVAYCPRCNQYSVLGGWESF
jgi:hypothetical protein